MNSEVVFAKKESVLACFLEEELSTAFKTGGSIAIKLHMGEPGNTYYIKASFVKNLVAILKKIGCSPFLFDTPVVYRSPRNNVDGYMKAASEHGYTREYVGAPIVISNRSTPADGRHMKYEPAVDVIEADGVLLLSHFKGHIACGMGGAVKNIGMGCMSKETKGAIHNGGEPVYAEGCTQCGTCVEQCPTDNIRIDSDRPRFDRTWCPGCSNCAIVCPENCIFPRLATFDELLAEAAVVGHKLFKKVYALNVLKNITKLCDCISNSGPVIVGDIGYVCGRDFLSVDLASLELVKKTSGHEDLFARYNKRSSWRHVLIAAALMEREKDVEIRELT